MALIRREREKKGWPYREDVDATPPRLALPTSLLDIEAFWLRFISDAHAAWPINVWSWQLMGRRQTPATPPRRASSHFRHILIFCTEFSHIVLCPPLKECHDILRIKSMRV